MIFKCPECDEGHVVMRALVWILANSGEVVGHNEWDDKSDAHCDVCNWSGSVADLSKEEEKMNLYIGSYTDAQRVTNVVTLRAASIDEATELLKADTERRLGAEITLGEPEDDEPDFINGEASIHVELSAEDVPGQRGVIESTRTDFTLAFPKRDDE